MISKLSMSLLAFVIVVTTSTLVNAQSANLLHNPNADRGGQSWQAFGETTIELTTTKDAHFVIRNGGWLCTKSGFVDVSTPLGVLCGLRALCVKSCVSVI